MPHEQTDGEVVRMLCEASLRAALRVSEPGAVAMNATTLAGLLLAICGSASDAVEVVDRLPHGPVLVTVREYLEQIACDERADTLRPQAAAGGTGR